MIVGKTTEQLHEEQIKRSLIPFHENVKVDEYELDGLLGAYITDKNGVILQDWTPDIRQNMYERKINELDFS